MGSSYSIVNDTNQDVWVQDGTCWNAVIWPVLGVGTVASGGLLSLGPGVFVSLAGVTYTSATLLGQISAGGFAAAGGVLKMSEIHSKNQLNILTIS